VTWQKAFVLFFQGKVEIIEEYGFAIRTVSQQYRIPAVIRLRRWVNLKRQPPAIRFSRANLYARDESRCQYCYRQFPDKDLTLDHVLPVVRGGKKTWENIVTACVKCNQRKGHHTPEEMGLKLLRKPTRPTWLPGLVGTIKTRLAPEQWSPYLKESG
jgi:5-methylcytosine-specific restriction endonuclease McrA